MKNFEWHSDEQHTWAPGDSQEPPSGRRWTPWKIALVMTLMVAAAAGFTLYRQSRAALQRAEEAVRQSAAFLLETSVTGDEDLFRMVVDGRDRAWSTTVLAVNREHGYFKRRPVPKINLRPPEISAVELSPDLSQSLVTTRIDAPAAYALDSSVTLDLPVTLRAGHSGQWLLAPPDPDFWGQEQLEQLDRIGAIYPDRDEAVIQPLLNTLNRGVLTLCAPHFKLDCPDQLQLSIIFSTDPSALTIVQQPLPFYTPLNRGGVHQFIVPAPSVLGNPSDDQIQTYLEEFYVRPILYGLIASRTGYPCCEHALFFAAMAEQMLLEAKLVDPLLTEQEYADLLLHEEIAFNLRVDIGWQNGWLEPNHAIQWPKALAAAAFIHAADPALAPADAIRTIGERGRRLPGGSMNSCGSIPRLPDWAARTKFSVFNFGCLILNPLPPTPYPPDRH